MQGKIVRWNEERGFGFVKEEITGTEIFIHISTLNIRNPRPEIGEEIEFETTFDDKKGKTEVKSARFTNPNRKRIAPQKRRKKNHAPQKENSMLSWIIGAIILVLILMIVLFAVIL